MHSWYETPHSDQYLSRYKRIAMSTDGTETLYFATMTRGCNGKEKKEAREFFKRKASVNIVYDREKGALPLIH